MNIFILSAGTRNKIVQYLKKELTGKGMVIAADISEFAPAIYEADKYYTVPHVFETEYLDRIIGICKKDDIIGVLSLIDPELLLLAENEDKFAAAGAKVIGSPYEQCKLAWNKYKMYCWLTEHHYRCAKTYIDKEAFYADVDDGKITYPVFIKPMRGSASIGASKAYDRDTVEFRLSHEKDLMIQEFLDGQEIGADVYVDTISHEVVSIFTRKKFRIRAGETDKAVSFKDDKLFVLIERFVMESGFCGEIDIDIFESNGEYYINEVNPRFGGGYPHAHECGCDHIKLIVNNLEGKVNEKHIGEYEQGICMMKYSELLLITSKDRID